MEEKMLERAKKRTEICSKVKSMMVEQLDLEIEPEFITNDQPIFGRGLELDSIDALELAVGIFDTFEVSVADDNATVFSSVNTMADYIQQQIIENEGI